MRLLPRFRFLFGLLWLGVTLSATAADFYLSPTGDDQAPGTSTNAPWRTLQTAVHRIRGGDTLWLAGGSYRGLVISTNATGRADAPLTLKPLPGQTALLKGSRETTGWVAVSNGVWRLPAWNHRSQQVFVDGEMLQQLGWPNDYTRDNACSCASNFYIPHGFSCGQIDAANGGIDIGWPVPTMPEESFFYDTATGELYLRMAGDTNPNERLVEVSVDNGIFYDNSKTGHWILEDLHFLHTSTLTYTNIGWPGVKLGPHGVLLRGSIERCDGVGLYMLSNTRVEDCFIGYNGINGINNNVSTNVVIRGCSIQYNNYRRFTLDNAAGIKIIPWAGATVENCDVSNNACTGIWFDTCDAGHPIVVRNNRVANNVPPPGSALVACGIFIEVSRNAEVYGNVVVSNRYIGIEIAGSADCRVHNNVVSGSQGLYAVRVHRQDPEHPLDGVEVFNNLIVNNRCDADIVVNRSNEHLVRRIRMDHNLVHRAQPGGTLSPTASSVYARSGQILGTVSGWRTATGYEEHGMSLPPLVDPEFRPLAGSPLIDAGSPEFTPPGDRTGAAAATDGTGDGSAAPDIGAHEYFAPTSLVRYVNIAATAPTPPYTTPATAATDPATALAAAAPGDVIEIAPGTYPVPATLAVRKPVRLRGRNAGEPPVLEASGPNPHRVLLLAHPGAVAEGLVLRGGNANDGGGARVESGTLVRCRLEANQAAFFGGGAYVVAPGLVRQCTFTSNDSGDCGGGAWLEPGARAEDCLFYSNTATNRGGAVYLRPLAVAADSSFTGNRAGEGAGAYAEGGVAERCRFERNIATSRGGGMLLASSSRAEFCRFIGNQAALRGGGAELEGATALFRTNLVTGNQSANGAGVWAGAGNIQFCTLADNTASGAGGGLHLQAAARGHSLIVYYNQAPAQADLSAQAGSLLEYSCASMLPTGTSGTTSPPRFRNRAGGDYRPGWESPCVDTGHPTDVPATDLDFYPRVRNGDTDGVARADMGALESGLLRYVDKLAPAPANPYADWSTAARTIGDALAIAQTGDIILVAAGTYALTSTVGITRAVEVRSLGGPEVTILDGQNAVRCVNLAHASAVLDGFTLARGRADAGAGAYLRKGGVVRNCILTGNESTGDLGAQFAFLTGNYPNPCTITRDNSLHEGGGAAVLAAGGLLENCLIHANRAAYAAGALVARGGTLRHCTVVNNLAGVQGGGVVIDGGGTVSDSILFGNTGGSFSNLWTRGVAPTITTTCASPRPSGEGNLEGAPGLQPAAHLYRPMAGAAVLDLGLDAPALPRDLAGTARPADGDGDGLSRSDLGCWEFVPSPSAEDADRDGLSNEAEASHGTQPQNPDSDGDGVSDGEEVQQATAPLDPTSWLKLSAPVRPGPEGILLRWRSVSNRVYTVHRSGDLRAGFDTPLATGLPATPPVNTRIDSTATGAGPYFYRVTSDPAP